MCQYNDKIECKCTYTPKCERSGTCCECVAHHRKSNQFPACFFSPEGERAYDRSYEALVRDRQRQQ